MHEHNNQEVPPKTLLTESNHMVDINKRYNTSFILRRDDSRRIHDVLVQQVGSVHFSAGCLDGITRNFDTFEELDSYENSPAKAVSYLQIRSRRLRTVGIVPTIEQAEVIFQSDGRISISITGLEKEGLALRNDLEDILDGMRPWHSFITRFLQSNVLGLTALFLWVVFAVYLYVENRPTPDYEPDPTVTVPLWGIILTTALFAMVCLIIPIGLLSLPDKIKEWLFPGSYFALGRQGESRYDKQEKFRWFFLTLISGMVISLLFFAANLVVR